MKQRIKRIQEKRSRKRNETGKKKPGAHNAPGSLPRKHFTVGVSATPLALSPSEVLRCQCARTRGRVGHSAGGHPQLSPSEALRC
jgi:hypothetical protein